MIVKSKVRKNGFDCPFSTFQVISWIMAAFICASFILSTVSLLMHSDAEGGSNGVDIACSVIAAAYFISFMGMVIFTVKVTKSDPTDPTVSLERLARSALKNKMAKIDFNPEDYQFHCDVCDTHVLKNTKHC